MASGTGSLLRAMIEDGLRIDLVVVDKLCPAFDIAKAAGIPVVLIDRRDYGYEPGIGEGWDRFLFTLDLATTLNHRRIDLVAMAGFMTILDQVMFVAFNGYIHPALLPLFPGDNAVGDALAASKRGETKVTGTTIHIATAKLDDATYILEQAFVPIQSGDNRDSLHEAIKVKERVIYPRVLREILTGELDLNAVRAAAHAA
jgi:phosphoribosylglycinamide formyltransferase-1